MGELTAHCASDAIATRFDSEWCIREDRGQGLLQDFIDFSQIKKLPHSIEHRKIIVRKKFLGNWVMTKKKTLFVGITFVVIGALYFLWRIGSNGTFTFQSTTELNEYVEKSKSTKIKKSNEGSRIINSEEYMRNNKRTQRVVEEESYMRNNKRTQRIVEEESHIRNNKRTQRVVEEESYMRNNKRTQRIVEEESHIRNNKRTQRTSEPMEKNENQDEKGVDESHYFDP